MQIESSLDRLTSYVVTSRQGRAPGILRAALLLLLLGIATVPAPANAGPTQVIKRPDRTAVEALAFSPDGRWLAVGSSAPAAEADRLPEGTIELWELNPARLTSVLRRSAWTPGSDLANAVTSLAFSPDGRSLLVGHCGGHAIWDLQTRQQRLAWRTIFNSRDTSPAWAPDGRSVAIPWFPFDEPTVNGIAIMDATTGRQSAFWPVEVGYVRSLRFSPDGTLLATAGHDCAVRVFHVPSRTNVFTEMTGSTLWATGFAPDNRTLVAGPVMGGALRRYLCAPTDAGSIQVRQQGSTAPTREEIHDIEFTRGGDRAVTVSHAGLRIWNPSDWSTVAQIPGCIGRLTPDGRSLVLVRGTNPESIEIWPLHDLETSLARQP